MKKGVLRNFAKFTGVNFAKFLRISPLQDNSGRLLLPLEDLEYPRISF